MSLLKTCIDSHQDDFQDPNKLFHSLYMGMSGSTADPHRAELMGRVGVIPYRNDRQEQIKRECWWTWWYRWVTLRCRGEIQQERGWVKMLCVEYGVEVWAGGMSEGSIPAQLQSIIRKTNTIRLLFILIQSGPRSVHPNCNILHRVYSCPAWHSSTFLHCASSSCLSPAGSHRTIHYATPGNNRICS